MKRLIVMIIHCAVFRTAEQKLSIGRVKDVGNGALSEEKTTIAELNSDPNVCKSDNQSEPQDAHKIQSMLVL